MLRVVALTEFFLLELQVVVDLGVVLQKLVLVLGGGIAFSDGVELLGLVGGVLDTNVLF